MSEFAEAHGPFQAIAFEDLVAGSRFRRLAKVGGAVSMTSTVSDSSAMSGSHIAISSCHNPTTLRLSEHHTILLART